MNEPYKKYTIVWVWKLHTDNGEHISGLSSKFIEEKGRRVEIRFFKVEGKKRPAIVWTSNSSVSKLIMLTTGGSLDGPYQVTKLGDVLGEGEISRFDADKRKWTKYPNQLIESVVGSLSDELQNQLILEVNAFEMNAR